MAITKANMGIMPTMPKKGYKVSGDVARMYLGQAELPSGLLLPRYRPETGWSFGTLEVASGHEGGEIVIEVPVLRNTLEIEASGMDVAAAMASAARSGLGDVEKAVAEMLMTYATHSGKPVRSYKRYEEFNDIEIARDRTRAMKHMIVSDHHITASRREADSYTSQIDRAVTLHGRSASRSAHIAQNKAIMVSRWPAIFGFSKMTGIRAELANERTLGERQERRAGIYKIVVDMELALFMSGVDAYLVEWEIAPR